MIWLSKGDRIRLMKPRGYRKRFPFRTRRTQAWNRERRRHLLRDETKGPQRQRGFYVVKEIVGTSSLRVGP